MDNWKIRLFGFFSILSLIISIISFCTFVYYDSDKISILMSGFSFVVTSLSVLVAVLLGWQIYNIINLNKTRDEINKEKEEIKNIHETILSNSNKNLLVMSASMAEFYTSQYLDTDINKEPEKGMTLFFGALLNKAMSIELCTVFKEVEIFNSSVNSALLIVTDMELLDTDKNQIKNILSRVPESWRTKEFLCLFSYFTI